MGTANCQSTGKRCACRRPAGRNVLRAEAFRRPRPSRHRYRPQGAEQQPRVRAADTPRRTSLSRGAHRKGRMAECCTVTLASGPDQDVDRPADYLLSSRILHRHDHADAGRLRFSERPSVHRERGANQDGFGTVTDVMPVVHTTGAPGGHRGGGGLSTSGARCDAYGERERALCSSRLTGLVARHQRGKARPGAAKSEPRTLGGPVVNLRTVAPIEQPSIGDSARHQSHQAFSLIGCAVACLVMSRARTQPLRLLRCG